ncbi:hypothetical protein A3A18_03045 [Candidatus Azambacteria bacterium RIFCSPLOWO2_01_FULL_44_84]|nr:MAG: hypothetical protein A3A18_03045 [Candidatus Azambacteria bacterium RIFCSPLOWO2_01_FULL_44_84]
MKEPDGQLYFLTSFARPTETRLVALLASRLGSLLLARLKPPWPLAKVACQKVHLAVWFEFGFKKAGKLILC